MKFQSFLVTRFFYFEEYYKFIRIDWLHVCLFMVTQVIIVQDQLYQNQTYTLNKYANWSYFVP